MNYKYTILEVLAQSLRIQHIAKGDVFEVPLNTIRKNFQFNYCATCHSVQGSTIHESITIYDWRFYYTSRQWIWTAVTRATSLNNVHFYDYVEPELNQDLITAYFNRRISGYKGQDNEAGRTISKDNYVNAVWFRSCVNKYCYNCGTHLYIDFSEGNVLTNITADRVDNDMDHSLDNILPCCRICNCFLSNK